MELFEVHITVKSHYHIQISMTHNNKNKITTLIWRKAHLQDSKNTTCFHKNVHKHWCMALSQNSENPGNLLSWNLKRKQLANNNVHLSGGYTVLPWGLTQRERFYERQLHGYRQRGHVLQDQLLIQGPHTLPFDL